MSHPQLIEALTHSAIAVLIAPMVALSLAAILDWASRRKKDEAILNEMTERLVESVVGGAVEAFLVALVFAGALHSP